MLLHLFRCGSKSARIPCVLFYKEKAQIAPEYLKMDLTELQALRQQRQKQQHEAPGMPGCTASSV